MVNTFIGNLVSLGYKIEIVSHRPQIYKINEVLVNIRSTSNIKNLNTGQIFWYDVRWDVLTQVEFVIFIMTSPEYLLKIPTQVLKDFYPNMYPSRKSTKAKSFMINWDGLKLTCNNLEMNINEYYQNLTYQEELPVI